MLKYKYKLERKKIKILIDTGTEILIINEKIVNKIESLKNNVIKVAKIA